MSYRVRIARADLEAMGHQARAALEEAIDNTAGAVLTLHSPSAEYLITGPGDEPPTPILIQLPLAAVITTGAHP